MRRPVVDVLSFEGCPNRDGAIELVRQVTGELGIDADVRLVDVPCAAAAERERFLGSPTIRVDGRDIEPGADARSDFAFSCRVYRTESGLRDKPEEAWLRDALLGAS